MLVKVIESNEKSVTINFAFKSYVLKTKPDADGNRMLTHYDGYCAVTSDLLSDFAVLNDDTGELERELKLLVEGIE